MLSVCCAALEGSKIRKYVTFRSEYRPPTSTMRSCDGSPASIAVPSFAMALRIASETGRVADRRRKPNMGRHLPGAPCCEALLADAVTRPTPVQVLNLCRQPPSKRARRLNQYRLNRLYDPRHPSAAHTVWATSGSLTPEPNSP